MWPDERPNSYALPKLALAALATFVTVGNLFYAKNIERFYDFAAPPVYSFVSLLFVCLSAVSLGVAAISFLQIQSKMSPTLIKSSQIHWSIGRIVADAFFREKKIVLLTATVYALLFALLGGILVYQPGVDFSIAYAVNGPTWRVVTCCGYPGIIPVGLLYLPALHIGLQLIPLSILIMVFVSTLVGLNLSLLYRAFMQLRTERVNISGKKGLTTGFFGFLLGLFAGCPTCAAAFFLSMIAGTGATAFSVVVAEYEPLIIALTIPLLLTSIYWQAKSIRTLLQGCAFSPRSK